MTDSKNPFARPAPAAANRPRTVTPAGIAAALLATVAITFFFLWASVRANLGDLQAQRTKFAETRDALATAQAENLKDREEITALKSRVEDLEKANQQAVQSAKGLEDEMRADLESKDVTISKLQGKLTVNILDRVMFDSGETVLKPDGAAVMKKIAAIIAQHDDLKIQVIGHTDNVPIRPEAHGRFASNWELSTARALAAVHFLTEQAGVDPRKVGAIGYGEYRPIADNSTAEGRAKNRRIAVTILPAELAVADTPPPIKPPVGTNVPPAAPHPEAPGVPAK